MSLSTLFSISSIEEHLISVNRHHNVYGPTNLGQSYSNQFWRMNLKWVWPDNLAAWILIGTLILFGVKSNWMCNFFLLACPKLLSMQQPRLAATASSDLPVMVKSFQNSSHRGGERIFNLSYLYKIGVFSSGSIPNVCITFLTVLLSWEKAYVRPRDATGSFRCFPRCWFAPRILSERCIYPCISLISNDVSVAHKKKNHMEARTLEKMKRKF